MKLEVNPSASIWKKVPIFSPFAFPPYNSLFCTWWSDMESWPINTCFVIGMLRNQSLQYSLIMEPTEKHLTSKVDNVGCINLLTSLQYFKNFQFDFDVEQTVKI